MTKKNRVSPERMELAKKLVKEFDLKTVSDAQDLLKEIFGPMLQSMLEGELDNHLGYDKYERTDEVKPDSRNGHSPKTVTTSYGDIEIDIPRDRNGDFEPQVVKKYYCLLCFFCFTQKVLKFLFYSFFFNFQH